MPLPLLSGRRLHVATIATIALSILLTSTPSTAQSEPLTPRVTDITAAFSQAALDAIIAEASQRFGIPERWIRAVMQAESAGDPIAVSRAGAIGLMQIMPGTWDELAAVHGLGDDPFDPRDNVMAGAAYLRAMYNRFGSPGFLAAYNAGPGRYAEHLSTGRPLPRETRAYVARLAPLVELPDAGHMQDNGPPTITDWRVAPLYIEQFGDAATTASPPNQETVGTPSESTSRADDEGPARPPNALFIGPQAEVSP